MPILEKSNKNDNALICKCNYANDTLVDFQERQVNFVATQSGPAPLDRKKNGDLDVEIQLQL
jgi:hypothetical protein